MGAVAGTNEGTTGRAGRRPFEELVTDHGATVLRVCRATVGGHAAEDAWSETFLSAMRAYPDLDEGANIEAWLVTIARRKAIDQHRDAARRAEPMAGPVAESVASTGSHDLPGQDTHEELWDALRSLPSTQREAVAYHHLAGLPYARVGELLGNSEAAARRASADGMKRLRTIYRGATT